MSEIILCGPRLAVGCPVATVDAVLAALLRPLPKAKWASDLARHEKQVRAAREAPEGSRERTLTMPFLPPDRPDHYELDKLSLGGGTRLFYPPVPDKEPFRSLFDHAPDEAVRLVRLIANHATASWREMHELNVERRGTPLPLDLEFPWGAEKFWGTEREYALFRGTFEPHALATALMALEAWGFERLDAGCEVDTLLTQVLPGHTHIAVLGIAASWMQYSATASLVGLPIATSQRLWHADIQRLVQVDMTQQWPNEIGVWNASEDVKRGLRKLNDRPHRRRDIRSLAFLYATNEDARLKDGFCNAVAAFPNNLPFVIEEERDDAERTDKLRRTAQNWSLMANAEDYSIRSSEDGGTIEISAPAVDTPEARAAAQNFERINRRQVLFILAEKVLEGEEIPPFFPTIAEAVEIAKEMEGELDAEAASALGSTELGGIVGMASVVLIREAEHTPDDVRWARGVLERAVNLPWPEIDPLVPNAAIPWHPQRMATYGLAELSAAHGERAEWAKAGLLALLAHPLDVVSGAAFAALMEIGSGLPRLASIALVLRIDLDIRIDPLWPRLETEERSGIRNERVEEALRKADEYLRDDELTITFPMLPDAWMRVADHDDPDRLHWREPDRWLNVRTLEDDLKAIDASEWLNDTRRELLLDGASRLLDWAIAKLEPKQSLGDQHSNRTDSATFRWSFLRWLGILCASLPGEVRDPLFVKPILSVPGDPGLDLVSHFTSGFVCAGVYDAPSVSNDVLVTLTLCADRLATWNRPYRDDYLDRDVDTLVRDLLMVSVEGAGGAVRFANGDYSEVSVTEPISERVLQHVGGHPSVVGVWLTLVERAVDHYSFDLFLRQAHSVLDKRSPSGWRATRIPVRLSNLVQHFVERATPTRAQVDLCLVLLDALIDDGDRRSAALQNSEVFRSATRARA